MTTLVKPLAYSITPATEGTLGTPYVPAQPERTVVSEIEVCDYTGCHTTTVYSTIPASEAIPATPSIPPSPAVITSYYDRAWNSAADTIGSVAPGQYLECKVKYGSYAVFVGLEIGRAHV